MRRRREASRRLPELADGRRDPMDRPTARAVQVRPLNNRTTEIADHPAVLPALRALGIRFMRARPAGAGWWIPGQFTEDLITLLEVRGCTIDAGLL